jgi:hypothetical protein
MPPINFFRQFLFSSKGLAPRHQHLLGALIKEVPILRSELLAVFSDPASVKSSAMAPKFSDFPKLKTYSEICKEIEGLSTPESGFFDGIVVKPSDYLQQGSLRVIAESGVRQLTIEETINLVMKATPKLNTGSNNTLDGAIENASGFRERMGSPELIHEYLAMDAAWWPSEASSILGLISKNILVEASIIPLQGVVNEAARYNPGLDLALDTSHSYAQAGRSMALSQFEPRSIIEVRSAFFAPLGRPESMASILQAKNTFAGEVSIIRPAFDPLEEAAATLGALQMNGIFDLLTTDIRLGTSSHKLLEITEALVKKMKSEGIDFAQLVDENYTDRPGSVEYSTSVSGEPETTITTRKGEAYSNEAWLEKYNSLLDTKSSGLTDLMKSQMKQLEELIKITGPSTEIESAATSLKENVESLSTATPENLYDSVTAVEISVVETTVSIKSITQDAQSEMSQDQKGTIEAIVQTSDEVQEQLEENAKEIEELNSGEYEPEEI